MWGTFSKDDPVLECHLCGETLRLLTPKEQKDIIYNPNNYIVFCKTCDKDKHERHLL